MKWRGAGKNLKHYETIITFGGENNGLSDFDDWSPVTEANEFLFFKGTPILDPFQSQISELLSSGTR